MSEILSPETKATSTSQAKTADEINDMFNELDNEEITEKPEKPGKEDKPSKKAKSDEEDEDESESIDDTEEEDEGDEIELEEPDEEVEELDLKKDDDIEVDAPPRKKEILKEYPELFKKFPWFEKMMYRDKQMNEMFGSFDDAKEAHERAETFTELEDQLMSGDTSEMFKNIKEADVNSFYQIVDNLLPNLHKIDKEAYFHVTGNLNRRLIMEMFDEAKTTDNEDLKTAALLVHQFVFGNSKFEAPKPLAAQREKSEQDSEAEKERLTYVKERYEDSRDDLQTRVDNTLRATISNYIDPRGSMSSYVKKKAIDDAHGYLREAIANDPAVERNLNKLWRAAFDAKFSKDSLGRIQSYYLSRAKANLKASIIKARQEALKDLTPRKRDKEEVEEKEETPRRRIVSGRPSQPKTGKNEMKKGESVTDFFMRD